MAKLPRMMPRRSGPPKALIGPGTGDPTVDSAADASASMRPMRRKPRFGKGGKFMPGGKPSIASMMGANDHDGDE